MFIRYQIKKDRELRGVNCVEKEDEVMEIQKIKDNFMETLVSNVCFLNIS